ncbi:hypothetical protein ACJ42C_014670 [Klebsiella pneumoniae]|uniref:hypothetical protein n=1 Tax=Klebsiella pneumoniae TaxID=573 RepID=UPI00388D792C
MQPTDVQKAALNRLYYDLKQAGILVKLHGLWLGINTSREDARLNIVNGSLPLTENGTINYNSSSGWTFLATAGWIPALTRQQPRGTIQKTALRLV